MGTMVISHIEKSSGDVPPPAETRGMALPVRSQHIPLPEMPNPLQFAGFVHPALRLQKPFSVTLHHDGGRVIAELTSIGEFGIGVSVGEAVDDLGKTLGELYFSLKS